MILILKLFLCVCLAGMTNAKSEEDVKRWFIGLGFECNKENPLVAEDLEALHAHKIPDNENAKCHLACVYHKAKWLNEKGVFDVDNAKAFIDKEHFDDATKVENSKQVLDTCAKVNEEEVKDGEKGCERSASLTKCLIDNAPKMGFTLTV